MNLRKMIKKMATFGVKRNETNIDAERRHAVTVAAAETEKTIMKFNKRKHFAKTYIPAVKK